MMASKQKTDIESALNLFMDLLVEEPDNVSALLVKNCVGNAF